MVESTVLADSRCVFPEGANVVYKELSYPECAEMLRNAELLFRRGVCWCAV